MKLNTLIKRKGLTKQDIVLYDRNVEQIDLTKGLNVFAINPKIIV